GFVLKEMGKRAEAVASFRQALAQFEGLDAPGIRHETVNVLNAIGGVHHDQGEYDAALEVFRRSLSLHDSVENVLNIGNALYYQGNYLEALDYYQRALKRLEAEPAGEGPGVSTALLGSLANIYYRLGEYDKALSFYQRNLPLLEKLGDKSGVAASLEGVGNVYRQQGDSGLALESYMRSLAYAEASGGKVSTANTLGSIGFVRAAQGNHAEALEFYARSLREFEKTGDKVGAARMHVNLGNAFYAQADYARALEAFQKALALREEMADKPGVGGILLGLGSTHAARGEFAPALEQQQKALALYEAAADKEGQARALKAVAAVHAQRGDFTQALAFAERAVPLAAQAGDASLHWRTLHDAGRYNKSLNRPAQARQAFEEAARLVEAEQARPADGKSVPATPAELASPFADLAELLAEQGKTAEAFFHADRAKAQALRAVLRANELRVTRTMTAAEQEQEKKLVSAIAAVEIEAAHERLRRQRDEAVAARLAERQRRARADYETFRARLYASRPRLKVFRGELPPLAKLEEVAALVPARAGAFLEYVVASGNTYLFVLTREPAGAPNLKAYALSVRGKELSEQLAQFQQSLARRDESYAAHARRLYDLLLKPAEEQLSGRTSLVISPDGPLWALPFQALQTADNRFLVEQAAVSYAPSLALLRELSAADSSRANAQARPAALAAFGNPSVSKATEARVRLTGGAQIPASPEVERELQALRQLYGAARTRVYTGAEAREERAKGEGVNASVLHFAAPTVVSEAAPLYSYVVLAGSEQGRPEDGLLYAWEVMGLDTPARVVVLPLASHAWGRAETGGGLVGLSWAWFVAGSPSVVVSQWPGAPAATAELMTAFNRQLNAAEKTSKAGAWQQAVRGLLQMEAHRHPVYWAGFNLIGDGR
ncbi:MAG TPA: CHAT domain-containing tetratricopeptide repeat protein, partial [Pyrinomonadaceae bacterium]|nr:CHAT domain-containing tetratricopeptide repeat protein [Pyrinomonadaceae bacterium]